MEITDIHCHVLPGIDDGARTGKESLQMLKMACEQGINKFFATSHGSSEFPSSRPDIILQRCRGLEARARIEIDPEIRIYPGQEILYSDSVPERLEKGELLSLAGSPYVLLEFFPAISFAAIYRAVRECAMSAYYPILAHIERYTALREEGRIEELTEAGAYMQMNYRITGGKWYEPSTRWAREMLKKERIHFLGTDMHNTGARAPEIRAAMKWLEKNLDQTYLAEICRENAQSVLAGVRIPI